MHATGLASPTEQHELAAAQTENEEQSVRLLDLPPELWSRIVRLAAVPEEPIKLGPSKRLAVKQQAKLTNQQAITRVCSAVRRETLLTFYGQLQCIYQDSDETYDSKFVMHWLMRIEGVFSGERRTLMLRSTAVDAERFLGLTLEPAGHILRRVEESGRGIPVCSQWKQYAIGRKA